MPIYVLQVIIFAPLKRCRTAPSSAAVSNGALRCAQQSGSPQVWLRRAGLFLFQIEGSAGCPGLGEPHAETQPSILFSQHDRDHALGDGRISRITGVVREALVEVVDLEEHLVAVGIERAKVMFFVRVVGVTK